MSGEPRDGDGGDRRKTGRRRDYYIIVMGSRPLGFACAGMSYGEHGRDVASLQRL